MLNKNILKYQGFESLYFYLFMYRKLLPEFVLKINLKKNVNQQHPFHLVDPSPWPILTSLVSYQAAITLLIVFHNVKTFHVPYFNLIGEILPLKLKTSYLILNEYGIIYVYGVFPFIFWTLFSLGFVLTCWFKDIITEATLEGQHTKAVQKNILFAFALFISSEVMFFFGFFWAYFHMALNPAVNIGCVWPPLGITVLDIWELPFLNTVILLSSGVSVTLAHRALVSGKKDLVTFSLFLTILYGLIFTCIQAYEYENAPFAINDGVYGSLFFVLTGFHGFHVCIGIIFLTVCLIRNLNYEFTKRHHIGFVCAAWYWHFVDVVWLFLFIVVYWWGS